MLFFHHFLKLVGEIEGIKNVDDNGWGGEEKEDDKQAQVDYYCLQIPVVSRHRQILPVEHQY
jgi:hypothetical protein